MRVSSCWTSCVQFSTKARSRFSRRLTHLGRPREARSIRLQGGTVRARSDGEGRGSEFIVELPYAGEAVAPASPSASIAMIKQAGRGARSAERILVVDDNEDAATLTAEALMTFGACRAHGGGRSDGVKSGGGVQADHCTA
jgi:hypothetical protein